MARRRKRSESPGPGAAGAPRDARAQRPRSMLLRRYVLIATLAAVILRIALVPASPKLTYPGDHDDFVRWGIQATDQGLLTLYDHAPPRWNWQVWSDRAEHWQFGQRPVDRVCNYPPGATYLLWLSGCGHRALAHDDDPSRDRLINTGTSHALYSIWSIVGDFLVAWGCAAIVALYRPRWVALLTYALVLLLPPLWWDSVIWAQMDAVILAPLVWMLYFMLRGRWNLAGVLWGVAFALKPQAILFVPAWALALLTARPLWRAWLGAAVAFVTLNVIALPFTIADPWPSVAIAGVSVPMPSWFYRAYWENLFETYTNLTTLKAFNLWYLDLLLTDSLDAFDTYFDVTKKTWGQVFLLVGLAAGFAFTLWRWRRDPRGLVFWSAISLLCFVMLPTKVHERYLILALPFLGVAAALAVRLTPAVAALIVVFMAQITWPHWLGTRAGQWPIRHRQAIRVYEQRLAADPDADLPPRDEFLRMQYEHYWRIRSQTLGREWFFTITALLSTAYAGIAFVLVRPRQMPERRSRAEAPPGK